MGVIQFAQEVISAPHYRAAPIDLLQYAYAKWVFSRRREADPIEFLKGLGIDPRQAQAGLDLWRPELQTAVSRVREARGGQGGVSFEDGVILYGLARALRPEFVVETGVAAGISTAFFGAALLENARGTLFSIELPPSGCKALRCADGSRYSWQERGIAWAVPDAVRSGLKGRHHLILQDVRQALPGLFQRIPRIDIFFHDDLHTPDHMLWEYSLVWPHLRPGGMLVSDDANFGWLQFCRKVGRSKGSSLNLQRLTALRKDGSPGAPQA